MKKLNYNHTIYASYVGYITQAIVNNFAPLLFVTFQESFGLTLNQVAFLVTMNFGVQLLVDMVGAKYVDRLGYRKCIVAAHIFAAAGLIGLSVFPYLLPSAYAGILLSIVLYAIGGGLLEVLVSPIVEACPTEKKEAAMSLLHSFYCWGHVFVVLFSTVIFTVFGVEDWRYLAIFWAVIPLANTFFFAKVPLHVLVEKGESMAISQLLKTKIFWILFLIMFCSGSSEQSMSQWASAFAESGLGVSKTVGDLAGPCMFAVLMGTSRVITAKLSETISIEKLMTVSGCLCVVSYLLASLTGNPVLGLVGCGLCGLSVGIMWPGTFSMASKAMQRGGTAMFALLALAGDLGCSGGPTFVGMIADAAGEDLKKGILAAAVSPALLLVCVVLYVMNRKERQ